MEFLRLHQLKKKQKIEKKYIGMHFLNSNEQESS